MDSREEGSGHFPQPPGPPGSRPQLDLNRLPPPQLPPAQAVYTPYNPFFHSSTSSGYPQNPSHAAPFPISHSTGQHDGGTESLAPSPTSSRGTSGTDLAALSAMYGSSLGGAAASLGADARMGEGASPDASGGPPTPKVTQKADRSCKTCRQRRVRCGREYPVCSRCKKRRDECNYGEGVYVEETIEGSDQHKITELEAKVSSLELQLRTASAAPTPRPAPPPSSYQPPPAGFSRHSLPNLVAQSITDLLSTAESGALTAFLADELPPSFGSVDNRLAGAALQDATTCYLLDAALRACDTKLSTFSALTPRIPSYKARLRDLDPAGQVSVAVLCTLGVRTCCHPNLFGLQTVLSPDGTPSPPLFLAVGSRRESACRTLQSRAWETAWTAGLFWPKTHEELEALVGLLGLSFHEESKPADSRFLVRQAAGAFVDIRHGELSRGLTAAASKGLAVAIFSADAASSTRSNKPNIISASEFADYFATAGLDIPDLVNSRLPELVEQQLGQSSTASSYLELIATIYVHVLACYRVLNQVTSPRRAGSSPVLGFIRNLWQLLDQIHNAIQRLQQHLVSLTVAPPGADEDPHFIDHAILLAVRADDTLVTLIMYMHAFLMVRRDDAPYWTEREGDDELERVRAESTLRVYKCLKLLAFYCQLHCNSQDKHNVFHVLLRLSILPNWTTMASLRIGQPGGPLSDEFELTEEESDWFRQALELSLFYTPRTSPTLNALVAARQAHLSRTPQAPTPASALSPAFSNMSAPSPSLPHAQSPYTNTSVQNAPQQLPPTVDTSLPTPSQLYSLPSQHPPPRTSSSASIPYLPQQHPSHQHLQHHPSQQQQQQQASAAASASAQMQDDPIPFPFEGTWGQPGFADGAGEDLTSAGDVRTAFRSIDWADLSLTPAVGSDGSNSSLDDFMRRQQ
ncbi:hypothetical protein JCM8097_008330 [Rhodosporidiobolus ruineniae]